MERAPTTSKNPWTATGQYACQIGRGKRIQIAGLPAIAPDEWRELCTKDPAACSIGKARNIPIILVPAPQQLLKDTGAV
jgi:hypothetical protein